jgi:hypothetical protein
VKSAVRENLEHKTVETNPLIKKLRIQPGQRLLILNAPEGYLSNLGQLPDGVEVKDVPDGVFDFVQVFVKSITELEKQVPVAIKAVKYDGLVWICYPKQSSGIKTDINRDTGWSVVQKAGLRPVTQVAIDDTWSALRFRPVERVGS